MYTYTATIKENEFWVYLGKSIICTFFGSKMHFFVCVWDNFGVVCLAYRRLIVCATDIHKNILHIEHHHHPNVFISVDRLYVHMRWFY